MGRALASMALLSLATACGASDDAAAPVEDDAPPAVDSGALEAAAPKDGSAPSVDVQVRRDAAGDVGVDHAIVDTAFSTSDGGKLVLMGFNHSQPAWDWTGCPQGGPNNTTEYPLSLDEIKNNAGANAVRLWFLQSRGGPGQWDYFDLALSELSKRGMVAVITLGNEWGDCEPQNASNVKALKTLAWFQSGYKDTNDGYPLSYRDFVESVVSRYANDEAVLLWEMMNEPGARNPDGVSPWCNEQAASDALIAFQADIAGVIRSVDTSHLVTIGVSAADCGAAGNGNADFRKLYGGPSDVCDLHEYNDETVALPPAIKALIDACLALRKPVIIGENGICSNARADGSCPKSTDSDYAQTAASLARRATLLEAKYKAHLAAGASGYFAWNWSMTPSPNTLDIGPGDPLEALMKAYPH
jgi:hypothetical protein